MKKHKLKKQKHEKKIDELEEKDAQIKELTDTLKRLQADFENYKKRIEKEYLEFRKNSLAEFIKKLLPVLDNFELTLNNKEKNKEFVKAVEMIYSELYTILEDEGLKKIEALNKKFDPYVHEALLAEKKKGKEPNIVIEELQKGYKLNDKILRNSKVKVSK